MGGSILNPASSEASLVFDLQILNRILQRLGKRPGYCIVTVHQPANVRPNEDSTHCVNLCHGCPPAERVLISDASFPEDAVPPKITLGAIRVGFNPDAGISSVAFTISPVAVPVRDANMS